MRKVKSWGVKVMMAIMVSGAMAAAQRVPDVAAQEARERTGRELREALESVKGVDSTPASKAILADFGTYAEVYDHRSNVFERALETGNKDLLECCTGYVEIGKLDGLRWIDADRVARDFAGAWKALARWRHPRSNSFMAQFLAAPDMPEEVGPWYGGYGTRGLQGCFARLIIEENLGSKPALLALLNDKTTSASKRRTIVWAMQHDASAENKAALQKIAANDADQDVREEAASSLVRIAVTGGVAAEITPGVAVKLSPSELQLLLDKNADHRADLTLAELQTLLKDHPSDLFSDPPEFKRFVRLLAWCQEVMKQPRAEELLPLILKEVEARNALDRKPVGWDEIAIFGQGGDVGLLIGCVIEISGTKGFQKVLDIVVAADDLPKLKVLLKRVEVLSDRKPYDLLVEAKLGAFKSGRLKEAAERHLKEREVVK
ncbi:hypothetical protein [Luteolibacter sp. LG18]|uniref:hypothetical protein n=1 Tax=Luteolibacter sp. LG18 TaxID=2819286 RepID=UPI002B2849ED|nr:hypothetical protein llg_26280 [Luteolibacter sp. LG18]